MGIISNSDCNAIYGIVGSGVVCIYTTGGKGTCNGDSGGPLNMKADVKAAGQQWKQVGIVSFGASAGCEVGYPAGFTRTEYYLDWISSETNGVGDDGSVLDHPEDGGDSSSRVTGL